MSIIKSEELKLCEGCPHIDVEVSTRNVLWAGETPECVEIVAKCRYYDMCSRILENVSHG